MIEVKNATLTYPSGKGVFDLDFEVRQGEVTGYLGPNGSGKTTTIRQLMGFMKPNRGLCTIAGLDCYDKAPAIKKFLGYIPGEISFPDGIDGMEYLKFLCRMRGTKDYSLMYDLIDRFELDMRGKVKKYSKGMKQKLGIIIAFMHNPEVMILDEPTSGLDPLMKNTFIELINEEKAKGKTILMSSHMFEEVERTCDKVLIIRDGRIIKQSDVATLKSSRRRAFVVKTENPEALSSLGFELGATSSAGTIVYVRGEDVNLFIKKLSSIDITGLDIKTQGLEEIFLSFYGQEEK